MVCTYEERESWREEGGRKKCWWCSLLSYFSPLEVPYFLPLKSKSLPKTAIRATLLLQASENNSK